MASTIQQLEAAQEAAKLSNGDIARAVGKDRSLVGRYRKGTAELSVSIAERWAEACGTRIVVLSPHLAAVENLTQLAHDLHPEEIRLLERAVCALALSRTSPAARAVILAGLGLVAGQVEDLAAATQAG